jgi:hypothetical protein
MTTTTETAGPRGARRTKQPREAPVRPQGFGSDPSKTRRRPLLIALGVVFVVLAVTLGYFLYSTNSNTVAVIAVRNPIENGETIKAADLKQLQIGGGQDTKDFILVSHADDVIGKTATSDLAPGTVLTSSSFASGVTLPKGTSLVGIALSDAQMPSVSLHAGEKVRLVNTPVSQGDPPASDPTSYAGTVFQTHAGSQNQTIVDVAVDKDQAPLIAATAATGRIALILDTSAGE